MTRLGAVPGGSLFFSPDRRTLNREETAVQTLFRLSSNSRLVRSTAPMRYGFQSSLVSLGRPVMSKSRFRSASLAGLMAIAAAIAAPASAQPVPTTPPPTYADIADLADAADLVVHARIKDAITVPAERATNVAPGHARVYIVAETIGLLSGSSSVGESLKYLVDVPLDARGKVPKLKKTEVLLFARPVPGRSDELQLVGPRAQLVWSPAVDGLAKPILAEFVAPDAAPAITGVRDALSVAGTLSGESETQIFLDTRSGDPVSITVVRRPGMEPVWGVSYSEIVDQAARPPAPDTLGWYRLACFLPQDLPGAANLSQDTPSRGRAVQDYRFVMQQLGPCPRALGAAPPLPLQ